MDIERVEVKSSGGKSATINGRCWIAHNAANQHLPFRIAKVHRTQRLPV
jgi:hypothetical protein